MAPSSNRHLAGQIRTSVDENSSRLSISSEEERSTGDSNDAQHKVGYGTRRMLLLTCSMFGLQLIWSVLMVNGTPFLLSLGFPKSMTALIWVAPPLCGAVVQPLVGAYSDRCTHPWGKRRPYILVGAACTVFCLLSFAYTKSILTWFLISLRSDPQTTAAQTAMQAIAVFWVYALNVSIQPLQSGIRTLIVEQHPPNAQTLANAWASRFTGLGNVFMCAVGFFGVPAWISFGQDHFHSLVVVASVALLSTVLLCCLTVHEQQPLYRRHLDTFESSSVYRRLVECVRHLPRPTRSVCRVQFVSFLGWFPFLFYTSSYIGDLYMTPKSHNERSLEQASDRTLSAEAIRKGNLSGFVISLVTLCVATTLPTLIGRHSLVRIWASSHILFATCMLFTLFVDTYISGIAIMSAVGACWAVTIWVPYVLIGSDIASWNGLVQSKEQGPGGPAGTIIGIHNLAVSFPQILAALTSSFLFLVLSLMGITDSIGWVLRAAAIPSLAAACMIMHSESEWEYV